jgi:O-phosphoseryl-tRNA(Cys) synthetase
MLKKYEAGLAAAGDDDDARQKWKDWWDKFINDTKKYTETVNNKESVAQEIANKTEELLDLDYEELEYAVDIQVQVSDWNLKTLERRLKNIEDDAFSAAEAIKFMGE